MTKNFVLTLAGIITIATMSELGFSSSAYAQQNNSQNPEIIRETEPNTNDNNRNQTPQKDDNNTRIIVVPSYRNDGRSYHNNYEGRLFDSNRSRGARNYYESLMEPYHQRYNIDRNPLPSYQRRDYNRPYYRR